MSSLQGPVSCVHSEATVPRSDRVFADGVNICIQPTLKEVTVQNGVVMPISGRAQEKTRGVLRRKSPPVASGLSSCPSCCYPVDFRLALPAPAVTWADSSQ